MNRAVVTRHAVSLVELMVVLSACSVILTMSATLLHRTMRTQSQARAILDVERHALRLARQFRHDVHQATAAHSNRGELGDDVLLRLELPDDRSVEYRHRDGVVLRTMPLSDGRVSREEFAFPPSIELAIRTHDSPPQVVLTMTPEQIEPPIAGTVLVSLHVEAGLHRAGRIGYGAAKQEQSQ